MYGLDLFSGIGGITKALSGYVEPIAYCEIEPYARAVLLSRMATGDIPKAPIWDDVRELKGSMLPPVDIIYGGFPCQDISVAGKQVGLGGERSGLFFEIVRLARETNAEWLFLENVPNIRTKGLGRVLKELDSIGYDCRWGLLSAADVGANHKRERWFLLARRRAYVDDSQSRTMRNDSSHDGEAAQSVNPSTGASASMAHSASESRRGLPSGEIAPHSEPSDGGKYIPDPNSSTVERTKVGAAKRREPNTPRAEWWAIEPNVGRVANGVPKRVDRLRALGNAVVPAQAREAFERLMGVK